MAEPVSKIDTKALESGPIIVNAEMLKLAQEKVEREKEEKEKAKQKAQKEDGNTLLDLAPFTCHHNKGEIRCKALEQPMGPPLSLSETTYYLSEFMNLIYSSIQSTQNADEIIYELGCEFTAILQEIMSDKVNYKLIRDLCLVDYSDSVSYLNDTYEYDLFDTEDEFLTDPLWKAQSSYFKEMVTKTPEYLDPDIDEVNDAVLSELEYRKANPVWYPKCQEYLTDDSRIYASKESYENHGCILKYANDGMETIAFCKSVSESCTEYFKLINLKAELTPIKVYGLMMLANSYSITAVDFEKPMQLHWYTTFRHKLVYLLIDIFDFNKIDSESLEKYKDDLTKIIDYSYALN